MLKTGVTVAEKLATEFYKPINLEFSNTEIQFEKRQLAEASFQSKFLSLMIAGIILTTVVSLFSGRR